MIVSQLYHLITKSDIDTIMKLLKCIICKHEVDIIGNPRAVHKKIKCHNHKCLLSNNVETKGPEVFVIRKRPFNDED
jgi:hypothetical protein